MSQRSEEYLRLVKEGHSPRTAYELSSSNPLATHERLTKLEDKAPNKHK